VRKIDAEIERAQRVLGKLRAVMSPEQRQLSDRKWQQRQEEQRRGPPLQLPDVQLTATMSHLQTISRGAGGARRSTAYLGNWVMAARDGKLQFLDISGSLPDTARCCHVHFFLLHEIMQQLDPTAAAVAAAAAGYDDPLELQPSNWFSHYMEVVQGQQREWGSRYPVLVSAMVQQAALLQRAVAAVGRSLDEARGRHAAQAAWTIRFAIPTPDQLELAGHIRKGNNFGVCGLMALAEPGVLEVRLCSLGWAEST
jgi:hypothetical protein